MLSGSPTPAPAPKPAPKAPKPTPATPSPNIQPSQALSVQSDFEKQVQAVEKIVYQKVHADLTNAVKVLEESTIKFLKEQEEKNKELLQKTINKPVIPRKKSFQEREEKFTQMFQETIKKLEAQHSLEMAELKKKLIEQTKPETIFNNLLYLSAEAENISQMKFALDGGANVNMEYLPGESLLFISIQKGKFIAAEFLLENGGDLEAKDTKGDTILSRMCQADNKTAVTFILQKSSKCHEKADNLLSIFDKKPTSDNKGPKLKEAYQLVATSVLFQGAKQQNGLQLVKEAIEKGADINAQDYPSEETPLHTACRFNQTEIVKYLLSKHPNLALLNKYNELPDVLTTEAAIKDMLSAHREKENKAAGVIQSHLRRFFTRKHINQIEEYRKKLCKECQPFIIEQMEKGNVTVVSELTKLLDKTMFPQSEDQILKIIGKQKPMEMKKNSQ